MDKKRASLISMIMLGVYLVMSFMPIVYVQKYFIALFSPGAYQEKYSWHYNSYVANVLFLAIVCAALAVAGIVFMFFHYTGKDHKLLKYGSYAPVATFAVFVIMSVYELTVTYPDGNVNDYYPKGTEGYWRFDADWGFYIMTALLIVAAALSFMIATGKSIDLKSINPSPASPAASTKTSQPEKAEAVPGPTKESLEELIKYKDLLDNDIITSDEFEAKKQEILGVKVSKPKDDTIAEKTGEVSEANKEVVEITDAIDKHSDVESVE